MNITTTDDNTTTFKLGASAMWELSDEALRDGKEKRFFGGYSAQRKNVATALRELDRDVEDVAMFHSRSSHARVMRMSNGYLAIGCCEFDTAAEAALRKWAGVKKPAKKAKPVSSKGGMRLARRRGVAA